MTVVRLLAQLFDKTTTYRVVMCPREHVFAGEQTTAVGTRTLQNVRDQHGRTELEET